jgi:YegS/Rv2252/BmrU family lipid kinase
VEVREVVTSRAGHARDLLRARAEGWDAVLVLGGDGTVMEVAGALAHSGIPIGVLRGGTGNLIAGALGMPTGMRRSVRAVLDGARRPFDLGRLPDGRYFAFAAGVGADVAMVLRTTRRGKRLAGVASYAVTAVSAALRLERVHVRIHVDDAVITGRPVLAMIANAGRLLGGLVSVGPDVVPDDGELNLCLFEPSTRREVVTLITRMLRRDYSPHPAMRFVRGSRFRIEADPPVPIQADGDIVGVTPMEIGVEARAVEFLTSSSR